VIHAGLPQSLRAEWIKLRSVRSTVWLILAGFGLTVAFSALVCASSTTAGGRPGHPGDNDMVRDSLTGVWVGQIAFVVLGVLAIGSEYSTGTIRATFAANPRRWTMLASKSALVGVLVLACALPTAALSFLLGQWLLRGNGFTYEGGYPAVTLADASALRAVVGTALYLAALALLALGLTAVLRSTAVAISIVLGLLFVPVIAAGFLPDDVGEPVQRLTPLIGLAVQQTTGRSDNLPAGPWAGLGAIAVWAVASLVAALWLVRRRDA
jgi:ABC-2 type transport system permease protein